MITGVVTDDRQAVVHLTVRGPAGQEQEIEAIIDTGFDGSLSLPSSMAVRAFLISTKPRSIGTERLDVFPWTKPKPFR